MPSCADWCSRSLTPKGLCYTILVLRCSAEVAQLVEHLTENQGVPSSILGFGTWAANRRAVVMRK